MRIGLAPMAALWCWLVSAPSYADNVRVIGLGGNGSCKDSPFSQPMAKPFEQFIANMKTEGHKVTYTLSCYDTLSYDPLVHDSERLRAVRMTNRAYIDHVEKLGNQKSIDYFIIIGHSYGGWMALQLALKLPAHLDIRHFVTADPISQVNCKISDVVKRFKMEYSNETPLPGCQQAPQDISPGEYLQIKSRVKTWRHYFQSNNETLRSGPIPEALPNFRLFAGDPETVTAHGNLILRSVVWTRLGADAVGRGVASSPADEQIIDDAAARHWQLDQNEKFRYQPIAEAAVRLRLLYQKYTVTFYPRSGSREDDVVVMQPNSKPALGLSVQIGRDLTLNYARTISGLDRDGDESVMNHYFGELVNRRYMVRLRIQDYKGFDVRSINSADASLFNDSLFRSEKDFHLPKMRLFSAGLGAFYLFQPDDFSLPAHVTQIERQAESGYSFLAGVELSRTFVKNSPQILSDEQMDDLGIETPFSEVVLSTVALLPGIGFGLVYDQWYAGGLITWGYAYNQSRLNPSGPSKTSFASAGYLDGSMCYLGKEWFSGVRGYKAVVAEGRSSFGIATSYSSAEMFVGRYF